MSDYPYHGLRPFNRDETDIFFGREQHTDELIERLGKQHFLAVVGHSGCGKSSLVRTGLIPSLQAGFLAGVGTHWRVAELRPSNQPFANLAQALVEEDALGKDYQTALINNKVLKRSSLSLQELLAIKPLTKNAKLLIVCDQFEEIFRYYEQGAKAEAEAFVKLLLASCLPYRLPDGTETRDIYIVLTMRSDFLGDCALFSGLTERINKGLYLTPRLTREQLREAIEEPAFVFGGEVASDLVVRLLEDAKYSQDQLPLLQHVLMIMWRLATERAAKDDAITLTVSLYEEVGTLKQVLSNDANAVFSTELTLKQQALTEIMFRALCERSNDQRDTRRPQKLTALATLMQVDIKEVIEIIEVFRDTSRCFLMPPVGVELNQQSVIDISHESLIRQWEQLKQWVDQEAKAAETYQRLLGNALRYNTGEAALLQSPELEIMQKWSEEFKPTTVWASRYTSDIDIKKKQSLTDIFNIVIDFLQRSGRKARLRKVFFVIAFMLVSGLAGFSSWQWYIVNEHRHYAEEAQRLAQIAEKKAKESEEIAQKEKQQAEDSNRVLSDFVKITLDSLSNQKFSIIEKYIDDIYQAGHKESLVALLNSLIDKTESMDDEERQYWYDILPSMTTQQTKRLLQILFTEKNTLEELEKKYQKEIESLNKKHIKEWVDSKVKIINKNEPKTYLAATRAILEAHNIEGVNINDALKYLTEYKKASKKLAAEMYYLLGEYYKIKEDNKKSKSNFITAIDNNLKGDDLNTIFNFFVKTKETKLALKVANKKYEEKHIRFNEIKAPKYKISSSWKNKEKKLNQELGTVLEKIKLQKPHLENDFIEKINDKYDKPLKDEERNTILKTFLVKNDSEKINYINAASDLLYAKSNSKDYDLPNNFEQAIQVAEEIKEKNLGKYLNFMSALSYFYNTKGNTKMAIKIRDRLLEFYESSNKKETIKESWIAEKYGGASWYHLLAENHQKAIYSAKKGLKYDSSQQWIKTNLAHGYLFSNKLCKAEKIHLAMRNEKVGSDSDTWIKAILNDFSKFTEKNITHPNMEKIKKLLETGELSKECRE